MANIAIRAESLGKRYRIGTAREAPYKTIREAVVRAAKAPLRNLSRLRRLGTFREDVDDLVWALRDISFEIQHGEVFGVIGRNGAGKSTLLKILSRITEPTVGRAAVHGRVGSLLEVGTGFHPELTGRENIYLNGSILGMDRAYIDRKFEEIVEFSGVGKFIDTPVKRYSSGMYLRLAFAVAAHLEPEILVVDEVLAVGDAQFQKRCLTKMSDIRGEGRTVIFVSHNLTAVRALCDRALLLRQGTLVANTSASEAVSMYVAEIRDSVLSREYPNETSAPQNASVVVRKVAVHNRNGEPLEEIDTATPFTIDVDYATKQDGAFVGINLLVYDLENNLVFQSLSTLEPVWYGRPMPFGRYRTSCHIPGNLLNAEWYVIGVQLFGIGFSDLHLAPEVLRLEVQDASETRGDYFGQYPGVVRPMLEWCTRSLVGGPEGD
jgi:lipopolysaccharide transport system ATP-binding protein